MQKMATLSHLHCVHVLVDKEEKHQRAAAHAHGGEEKMKNSN